jgi:hypothetical protein
MPCRLAGLISLNPIVPRGGGRITIAPSGAREGGAIPPLPRNCKRQEIGTPMEATGPQAREGCPISLRRKSGDRPDTNRACSTSMGELKSISTAIQSRIAVVAACKSLPALSFVRSF